MLSDIFGIEKSKKSFGHNFSRRKFFGFAFSAGAAAVVAAPAVAKAVTGTDHGIFGAQGRVTGLTEYQKAMIAYCEADCHLDFIYSAEYRQYCKKWALGKAYGMGTEGFKRSVGKHPALGMGYEPMPLKFPNAPRYPWPTDA